MTPEREEKLIRLLLKKTTRDKETNCLIWTGSLDSHGYGSVSRVVYGTGSAHRALYILLGFEFNQKLDLCHKCDRPPCIEPSHLFPGTRAENFADAKAKGRPLGRKISNLNEANFSLMKEAILRGERPSEIARAFNVRDNYVATTKRNMKRKQINAIIY